MTNEHHVLSDNTFYLLELQSYLRTFYGSNKSKYSKERVVNAVLSDVVTLIVNLVYSHNPKYLLAVVRDIDAFEATDGPSGRYFQELDFRTIYSAVVSILQSFKITTVKISPREYISTIAMQYFATLSLGVNGVLVSNDDLFFQVVSDRSVVLDPFRNKTINYAAVKERFSVSPQSVPDIFGLAGSVEHHLPGVASIGQKAAIELITKYGTLENLLQNKQRIPKYGKTIALFENEAIESKKMATLSVPAVGTNPPLNLDELVFTPDDQGFHRTLETYGVAALLSEKFHGRSSYYSSSKLSAMAEPTVLPVFNRLDLKLTITSTIIKKYRITDASSDPVKTAYIYALVDPRDTERIKYVGKTVDPNSRLRAHINRASKRLTPKDEWLCQLRADGITPQINILEKVTFRYECEWGDREQYFIKLFFDKGFKLLNSVPGGPTFSMSNPNGGELQYNWEQCMLDRLKLWVESPTFDKSVKVWEAQIALSVQYTRTYGGTMCKYCGVYLPINPTSLTSLPFTDIMPFFPVSDKSLWLKEQEGHDERCIWWKELIGE